MLAGVQHVRDIRLTPSTGQLEPWKNGEAWTWEAKANGRRELVFISSFALSTSDRRLPSGPGPVWSELQEKTVVEMVSKKPLPEGAKAEVEEIVKLLKASSPRIDEAIAQMGEWLMAPPWAYDGKANYKFNDLVSFLKYKRGWCGHFQTLFLAVCQAAGIPARPIHGFALYNKKGELFQGFTDYNRHGWVEVYLPNKGWVEVEPRSKDPFRIPWQYVATPESIQSCQVQVKVGDKWTSHLGYVDTVVTRP